MSATISTTASNTIVYGTGSQNVFQFQFVADFPSDIQVIYTNADGQQTTLAPTAYLVAINNPAPGQLWGIGGTVTYPLSGSPIAAGTSLHNFPHSSVDLKHGIEQPRQLLPAGCRRSLDTGVMQNQQISARTGQLRGDWLTNTAYNFGDVVVDGVNGNNTGNLYTAALSNTSGVWTTDLANGDWSLALNVHGIDQMNPGKSIIIICSVIYQAVVWPPMA